MGQAQSKKKQRKRLVKFESKEEYFIKNGAILQEHQIGISQGRDIGARELKIFSNKEIERATNKYDTDLIFHDGYAIMYKATLENHQVVSIITPPVHEPSPDLINMFLMGASTRMAMNHENMVKIYGCCLETYIPMEVCEYFPNGTLFEQLHGGDGAPSKCMLWGDHLRVLTEIAYALSYMHNALPKPLVHRLLSSSGVYLDSSFHAKLARFGFAVSINPGDTSKRWPIQGTKGYIDPEYVETGLITDKCDVYSFGVLMTELLTRRQPTMMVRCGINLVDVFVSVVEKNEMKEMIDNKVLEQACWDEIQRVVELALACVTKCGSNRPTMIDVVGELWKIHGRDKMSSVRGETESS